jgi:hypothetical protein
MSEFIPRDYRRTESDDFKLNVESQITNNDKEAVPQYALPHGCYIQGREELIGWKIQFRYE